MSGTSSDPAGHLGIRAVSWKMQPDGESLCVSHPAGVHVLAVRHPSASLQILSHISRFLLPAAENAASY